MKCPICDVSLVMSDRQGVEIDYCPECRGVWLDRGELDKIIERSGIGMGYVNDSGAASEEPRRSGRENSEQHKRHGEAEIGKKKRGSFIADIFDFGD